MTERDLFSEFNIERTGDEKLDREIEKNMSCISEHYNGDTTRVKDYLANKSREAGIKLRKKLKRRRYFGI